MGKTPRSQRRGTGLIPGGGTKIQHAMEQPKKKKKKLPKIASNHQLLEETRKTLSREPSESPGLTRHLDFGLPAPTTERATSLCLKPLSLWFSSPGKLTLLVDISLSI